MKLNRISKVAIVATAAAGLVAGALVPANAATRSTVVIVTSNQLTGLNPSVSDMNLTSKALDLITTITRQNL